MAQYDGSIRINTSIDTQKAQIQLSALENRIVKTSDKIAFLRSKMDALKDAKIPTQEYKEIETDISKAERELSKLIEKQAQMQTEGKNSGAAWNTLNQRIQATKDYIDMAKGEMQELVNAGRAFTLGQGTEQYVKLGQQLQYAENDLSVLEQRYDVLTSKNAETQASYMRLGDVVKQTFKIMARGLVDIPIAATKAGIKGLISAFQKLGNVAKNVALKSFKLLGGTIKGVLSKAGSLIGSMISKLKTLGSTAKKSFSTVNKSAKKTGGLMSTIASRFKGIALSLLLFNWITRAFNGMVKAIKDGFGNLYNDNEKFKNSVDELRASVLTLKNAFAAAFRPLVELAIPYIQMAADKMTELLNKVGQFTAAITGQKTYTKAIRQTADAFKDAAKEAEGYLSPLDEINKYSDGKGKGEEEAQTGVMFEEVPIESKFKDMVNRIKDMWAKADFSDFGKTLGEKLKSSLDNIPWNEIREKAGKVGKSLASLLNGFIEVDSLGYSIGKTLAEAINTGFEFLNNFVHELHWDSIGKFVADTLNGFFHNIDWDLIYDTFVTGAKGLGDAINSFVDNLDWDAISTTIANFVNTFVDTVYTFFTTVNWSELGSKIGSTLSETIKKTDFEKVGRAIGSVIQAAINFVKNFISELSFEDIVNAVKDTLKGFFEEANWEDIAKIALSLLVGAFVMQSSKLKFAAAAQTILTAFQDELISLDWKKAGEVVGEYFINFFDFLADTIENIDWYAIGQKVKEFLVGIPWNEVADAFFEAFGAAIGGFAEFLIGLIGEAWQSVVDWWHEVAYEDGQFTMQGLLDGILDALSSIGDWIYQHIFEPIMEGFRNAFEIHSPSAVMEEMGNFIIEGLLNGLKNTWSSITSWIEDKVNWIIDKFRSVKDKVSGFFSGGGGGSDESYSSRSYSLRSMASPYAANPAFAKLAEAEIPGYATGQVIPRTMKQHLAWLGDNNRETEVVSPLSTIEQAVENVMEKINAAGGGTGKEIIIKMPVYLDGKVIYETVVNLGKINQMATGNNDFLLGTT